MIRGTLAVLLFAAVVAATAATSLGATGDRDSRLLVTLPSLHGYDRTAGHIGRPIADRASWRPLSFRPTSVTAGRFAGFGVAAKAADHLVAIGPAPEKAWAVLERVSTKGSPFQGYKGGGKFENVGKGQRLPDSGPGGPITYREWDVNPYVKGVNRGAERLVTGSDGSAYYTRDHYDTFVRFR